MKHGYNDAIDDLIWTMRQQRKSYAKIAAEIKRKFKRDYTAAQLTNRCGLLRARRNEIVIKRGEFIAPSPDDSRAILEACKQKGLVVHKRGGMVYYTHKGKQTTLTRFMRDIGMVDERVYK